MASDRELRAEYEGLQAQTRELEAEAALEHAPDFVSRRTALAQQVAVARRKASALAKPHAEAQRRHAALEAAIVELREALRVAEQRKLPWYALLLVPAMICLGVVAMNEAALRIPGSFIGALGLGFLFGDRAVRRLSPAAGRRQVASELIDSVGGSTWRNAALGPALIAIFAVLAILPAAVRALAGGSGDESRVGLALGLLTVMVGARAIEHSRRPRATGRSGAVAAVVVGCLVVLAGLVAMPWRELWQKPYPANWLVSTGHLVGASLWAPLAAWWLADRFWPRAHRASLAVSIACAVGAGVAASLSASQPAAHVTVEWDPEIAAWTSLFGRVHPAFVVPALQLGIYGLALGVRVALSGARKGSLRWVALGANLAAALALGLVLARAQR